MIGLIVDGASDEKTIPILAKKILEGTGIGIKPKVVRRGDKLNVRKMEAHVRDMIREQPGLEKIIVCVDSEDDDPAQLGREVKRIEKDLTRLRLTKYVLVVRALECWLLADEQALHKALGAKAKVKPVAKPETIRHPKRTLEEIFERADKTFTLMRDNPRIAQASDVTCIKNKCPQFAQFCEAVLDP